MLGHAAPAASAEKEQLIGGSESSRNAASLDATDAVAGQRGRGLRRLRLPRLPRLPRPPRLRLRRGSQELTGVGALFGVAQLVRAESDLPTVLALIARTISEALGFGTVVLNLYRREWDGLCITPNHGVDAVDRAVHRH